jgi:hypothetical protein
MPRTVNYNIVIDKNRTDGGFSSTTWWLLDPNTNSWSQLPALPGQEADSVKLQPDDVITVAIGESIPGATSTAVSSIALAVVFGSRHVASQSNSPFQGPNGPNCLFMGTTANGLQQAWSSSNNYNNGYLAWTMVLGTVGSVPNGARSKFELMIGANVTFNDGTPARSYGHDPEVDVGMGAN